MSIKAYSLNCKQFKLDETSWKQNAAIMQRQSNFES